jgi:tetratricopeptide (TPR) repeat protein
MKRTIALSLIAIVAFSCIKHEKKESYNSKAVEMNNKAVELLQESHHDSALILFDKAIELDKTYYLPHAHKVRIYLDKNDVEKALAECETSIKLKPDYAEGYLLAGVLYDLKGETKNALKNYLKSIELYDLKISDPKEKNNIQSNRLNKAVALVLTGEEKEGRQELSELKSEYPDLKIIVEFLKLSKEDYLHQLTRLSTASTENNKH